MLKLIPTFLCMAILFGQKSQLPAYYRRMSGNISDVATLRTTMKALDFLGAREMHFILDCGFYSEANVDEMLARRHHFTMAVPAGRKWVEAAIDRHYDSIASPQHYRQVNETEALYVETELRPWGEDRRRTYLHLYYNAQQAAEDFDRFTRELLDYKLELESGKRVEAHEEHYARFLVVKETSKCGLRMSFNDVKIQKHRKRYAGFFCILSTKFKDPMETLQLRRPEEPARHETAPDPYRRRHGQPHLHSVPGPGPRLPD